MSDDKISVMYVKGVEGNSFYLNEYRIAGPKPWGGGGIIEELSCTKKDVLEALGESGPLWKKRAEKADAERDALQAKVSEAERLAKQIHGSMLAAENGRAFLNINRLLAILSDTSTEGEGT